MGDRYFLMVKCPYCNKFQDEEIFYAPTCGALTCQCEFCGEIIDLEKVSGIPAESCATTSYGLREIKQLKKRINNER